MTEQSDGERLASLETNVDNIKDDVKSLLAEMRGLRGDMANLQLEVHMLKREKALVDEDEEIRRERPENQTTPQKIVGYLQHSALTAIWLLIIGQALIMLNRDVLRPEAVKIESQVMKVIP
jgi:chromosome segregation ATPase